MTEIEKQERIRDFKKEIVKLTEEEIKQIDEFIMKLKREGKR